MSASEIEGFVEELERRRSFLTRLLKDLRSAKHGESWDAVKLESILEGLVDALELGSDLAPKLAELRTDVARDASKAILELEADVRELCQQRGWRLDGQWPTLYVERAIEVAVSEKQRRISIGGTTVKSLASREVERVIEARVKALIPRDFDAKKFMAQLARAYDEAQGGRSAEVPLLQVYREYVVLSQPARFWRDARSGSFSELSADQFRARLSAALESGVTSAPDGRELRLLPPIDPKDAMFLYQPAERRFGFVGRIQFRPGAET